MTLFAAVSGCQHHPRKPLDEALHQSSYLARTAPQVEGVASLSLDQLELAADNFNPSLRELREAVKLAEADASTAGLWADPSMGFSVERMIKGEGALWSLGGLFSLEIPISGAPRYRERLAQGRVDVMNSALRAAQWGTKSDLRLAYVEYSRIIAKTQVLDELAARLAQLESRTDRIASAGEMTRIAKRMYNIEARMARTELAGMMAELDVRRLKVLEIAGLPPSTSITPDPSFAFAVSSSADVDPSHPELAMARAEFEAAERELELELRMQYPDVMLGAGPVFEGSDRSVMGELGIPLPLWNANRAGIARALSMRELERVRFEGLRETLENRAATANAMLNARRIELESMEREILPLADAQLADVTTMAEVAKVDPAMMLEALRQVSEIKLKIVDARADCAVANVELVMNTYQKQGGEP